MSRIHGWIRRRRPWAAWIACLAIAGCHATRHAHHPEVIEPVQTVAAHMPHELAKVVLPQYVIEPPDILTIEGIHIVPRTPYTLRTMDVLSVQVRGTLPGAPILGPYPIEPGGTINLGTPYGTVHIEGKTVDEAKQAIEGHLRMYLQTAEASVALAQLAVTQQVIGQFLVGPDGVVTLGSYGSVSVVGKSVPEAKAAIEAHLSQFLDRPVISLSVYAYNSKVYYIVLQGAGLGDGVYRFPVTGNETVLDAISQINGLEQVSSKKIWVSRPNRQSADVQVLPVDWYAITELADTRSNYQLLPGDRVFIEEDKWVAMDTHLAKFLAPFERIMGFSLLGVDTASRFSGNVLQGGGVRNRFSGGSGI